MEEIFLTVSFIFEGRKKRNGKILHLKLHLFSHQQGSFRDRRRNPLFEKREGTGAAGEDGFVEFLHVKTTAEFLFHGVSKLF